MRLSRHPLAGFTNFESMMNEFVGECTTQATLKQPPTDIEQRDDAFVVTADLPGVSKADLKIEVKESTLTISGNRSANETQNEKILGERFSGNFKRQFKLDESLDSENISANFENGVLTLLIPKAAERQTRTIEIQ